METQLIYKYIYNENWGEALPQRSKEANLNVGRWGTGLLSWFVGGLRFGVGQREVEQTAATRGVLDADSAAELLHDAVHN